MIKTTRKTLLLFSAALYALAVLYIFVVYPRLPLAKQLQNLKLAEAHSSIIREKFQKDARFQKVTVGPYTGAGGCLSVHGAVSTEEDIRMITNIVESSHCPVKIVYSLTTSNQMTLFRWYDKSKDPEWIRF